tara:strand:+ start:127 stop:441 length:315 start_codon:yes stop_codon:yes gene_type:complete
MLPKSFQIQNQNKRDKILNSMKLYTIIYDYELSKYYGEYIKESYTQWGNIVDSLGVLQLTGYTLDEAEFNFYQIIETKYINTKKLIGVEITDIKEESFISKSIS